MLIRISPHYIGILTPSIITTRITISFLPQPLFNVQNNNRIGYNKMTVIKEIKNTMIIIRDYFFY